MASAALFPLQAKQEELNYLLNSLHARVQLLDCIFVDGNSDLEVQGTGNNTKEDNDKRKKPKNKKDNNKKNKNKNKNNNNNNKGGKKGSSADTKSIYFPAPEPEPIPADFKGVVVDIEKDLMGKDTDVQRRLRELCGSIPIPSAKFKRAPSDYYSWQLEQRRDYLEAPHVDYLCKTMIMRNTKTEATDCSDRTNSKYYMIVIQYTAKMNKEKLQRLVRFLRPEKERFGKKSINLRVASAEDGVVLSGYGHNAVTPVGMAVNVPMIVSHRILELPYIWLGGGEVDVKLRISIPDLCRVFKPIIGDLG